MKHKNSYINPETCKACELCAEVCPNMLIEKSEGKKMYFTDDFEKLCINCGHCMAICPTESIIVKGLSYKDDFFSGFTHGIASCSSCSFGYLLNGQATNSV